jgi:hypothetical protein
MARGGGLLFAVVDELAAEHADVRIGRLAVNLVAVGPGTAVATTMFQRVERVAARVDAEKALAAANGIVKGGLAGRGHRGVAIGADARQIAACVKQERVEPGKVGGREETAILGEGELDVVLDAELCEDLLGVARASTVEPAHDVMLVSRRLGEVENPHCHTALNRPPST